MVDYSLGAVTLALVVEREMPEYSSFELILLEDATSLLKRLWFRTYLPVATVSLTL